MGFSDFNLKLKGKKMRKYFIYVPLDKEGQEILYRDGITQENKRIISRSYKSWDRDKFCVLIIILNIYKGGIKKWR